MRAWIIGEVVGTGERKYQKNDGSEGRDQEIFVKQDGSSPRYGADKVTAPHGDGAPTFAEGEKVALLVNVTERHGVKQGEAWGFLSVWLLEKHPHPQEAAPGGKKPLRVAQ